MFENEVFRQAGLASLACPFYLYRIKKFLSLKEEFAFSIKL